MSEPIKTSVTTIGSTNMNLPIVPFMNSIGKNAMIVVEIVVITGHFTSFTPRIEASNGGCPFSR